jgi:hypothetical protein
LIENQLDTILGGLTGGAFLAGDISWSGTGPAALVKFFLEGAV